ncbi:hypothetical protein Tco_1167814 [Tanacetum coccineum]
MSMTIQSSVKDKILATSSETSKVENAPAEMLRNLDQQMEKRADDGKANVVTNALSRKERVKPKRVRAMAMTYGVRGMILTAQSKAFKQDNVPFIGSKMDEAYASSLHVPLDEIKVDKTLCFVEEPVENSDREVKRYGCFFSFRAVMLLCVPFCGQAKLLAAKLLEVRYLVKVSWNSKGNFELTWVWEDSLKDKYPRLIVWLVKPLVLTYESVVMYGLCVYMRYVDERDRLIGIGLVMDLVKFPSFTFGGKEMTFVGLAFLR